MHDTTKEPVDGADSKHTVRVHNISRRDLPLSCPLPSASQWNAHPRVFLRLNEEGKATCPYCGTTYLLQQENDTARPVSKDSL